MASVDINSNNTLVTVTEGEKEIINIITPGPQGPAGADGAQGIPGPSGSDGTNIEALNTFTGSAQAEIDSLTAATGSYLTSLPSKKFSLFFLIVSLYFFYYEVSWFSTVQHIRNDQEIFELLLPTGLFLHCWEFFKNLLRT